MLQIGLKDRVMDYVSCLQPPGEVGFPISIRCPYRTLQATSFAVFIYDLYGQLGSLPSTQRDLWKDWIKGAQDPATGIFFDPLARPEEFNHPDHNWEYFTWQTTFFCKSALDALGTVPKYPPAFIQPFLSSRYTTAWLEGLNWSNPWGASNRVMFLISFLIHAGDTHIPHAILDWLDQMQDPGTGFWGIKEGAGLLNAMAGAFHFYFFYLHLKRPIHYVEPIVDHVLQLQQPDGLYHPQGGGGACLDLDAVDILIKLSLLTGYRQKEIETSLTKTYQAILENQRPSGAFCEALRPPAPKKLMRRLGEAVGLDRLLSRPYRPYVETITYDGWEKMAYLANEGDLWSTWFRSLVLALIETRYPQQFKPEIRWHFRPFPTLGWHDLAKIQFAQNRFYP